MILTTIYTCNNNTENLYKYRMHFIIYMAMPEKFGGKFCYLKSYKSDLMAICNFLLCVSRAPKIGYIPRICILKLHPVI